MLKFYTLGIFFFITEIRVYCFTKPMDIRVNRINIIWIMDMLCKIMIG